MALPEPIKGHSISENVITLVKNFDQSDKYSRVMPRSKDKVSIKKNGLYNFACSNQNGGC